MNITHSIISHCTAHPSHSYKPKWPLFIWISNYGGALLFHMHNMHSNYKSLLNKPCSTIPKQKLSKCSHVIRHIWLPLRSCKHAPKPILHQAIACTSHNYLVINKYIFTLLPDPNTFNYVVKNWSPHQGVTLIHEHWDKPNFS